MMKRRTFLATSGALALSTAMPMRRAAAAKLDVIVIGAGLSGLNAAMILEDQGANVVVLEGRHRVGGRVMSIKNAHGHVEAGANTMLAGYGRTLDICQRLGLTLIDYAERGKLGKPDFYLRDQVIKRADWKNAGINPFPDRIKSVLPSDMFGGEVAKHNPLASFADWYQPQSAQYDETVQSFLEKLGYDQPSIDLGYNINQGYGTSAYATSRLNWYFVQGWFAAQRANGASARAVKDGNSRLPEAMAKKLKSEVHFGKIVTGIRSGQDKAEVTCQDGSTWRADRIICSTPLPPLRNVRFDPPLSPDMIKAVDTIDQQRITQVHLITKKPFWDDDGLSPEMWTDTAAGQVMANRFGEADTDISSLTAWGRGFGADRLDQLDEADARRLVVAEIERIRPAARGQLEVVSFKSWQHDPFSGGDWVVWSPGQPSAFAQLLSKPHFRVHFCGEHTALVNRGMEAAMESGERAALEILGLG